MPLIDRIAKGIRTGIQTKFNPAMGAVVIQGLRSPAWTSANYHALAKEGYVANVDVFSCVQVISTAFAGIPWIVQTKARGGTKPKRIESGPLNDLLKRPNPKQGAGEFFEAVAAYQELAGNSYIFRFGPKNGGPPRELWALRPDRMTIKQSGNPVEPIERYEYQGIKVIPFEPDRYGHTIIHWMTFHPIDDWYGLSPIQVASRNVDQSNAAAAWNTSLFQNSARPSGALVIKDEKRVLTDDQFRRLEGQLLTKYTGTVNAGLPMILEGNLDWKQMSLSPADMAWLDGDERTTEKICRVFGVPPEMIGTRAKRGGLNDSSYKASRQQFYMEKMLPKMDRFRDCFNNSISPLFGDNIEIDYDRDEIEAIQEDRETVFTRTTSAVKSSIMRVNEGREAIGLKTVPGWDVFLVPNGITIMEEPGKVVGLPQPQPGGITVPPQNSPALPAGKPQPQLPAGGNPPKPGVRPTKSEEDMDAVVKAMLSGATALETK